MSSRLLVANPSINGPTFKFGDGGVVNYAATFFPGLGETTSGPASQWYVNQWSMVNPINPANVVTGAAASNVDPLYGAPKFQFSNVDHTHTLSAYQKPDGTWVYGLDAANDSVGNAVGGADLFLATSLATPITLDQTVNYQVDLRETKAVAGDAPEFAFTGFTLNFNVAGQANYDSSLPTITMFLQIDITDSRGASTITNYDTASVSADGRSMTLIAGGVAPGDPVLGFGVQNATYTLAYSSLNVYLTDFLQQTYQITQASGASSLGTLNPAFLDLSHWSLNGIYFGIEDNGTGPVTTASSQLGIQVSNILLSTTSASPTVGGSITKVAGSDLPAATPATQDATTASITPSVANAPMTFAVTHDQVSSNDALVDNTYYLAKNADVAASGVDPATHYAAYGWHEGRNPNALFDTDYYLANNPDVKASGMDPLTHYEEYGWKEGRNPSASFDTNDYLGAYADVRNAGADPLTHYLAYGNAEGRTIFHV